MFSSSLGWWTFSHALSFFEPTALIQNLNRVADFVFMVDSSAANADKMLEEST